MNAELSFRASDKIRELYAITAELENMFPGRHFTPDGHLVGSIGEVLAAESYGLELLPASAETHDGISPDGRLVQIKTTQTDRIAISSKPDYLIVLRLLSDGTLEEIYNGVGKRVWAAAGKKMKNGQRPVSVAKLRILAKEIEPEEITQKLR